MKSSILLLAPVIASAAAAVEVRLDIEIPQLDVGQYHRPYIAAWIENPDKSHAADLTAWYDQGTGKDGKGETWLKDLRQWWRKSGRAANLPIDGVSGPTRPVGKHSVALPAGKITLPTIAGDYTLVVEAAREVGGRELIRIPFKWDGKTPVEASARGKSELGKISIHINP